MNLLLDMNLTSRWVPFLKDAGHHCKHWSETGDPKASDSTIASWAREHMFVILTNDMDFPQILAHTMAAGPSVVLLRGAPLVPEARGAALLLALRNFESELRSGAIVTLDWSNKLRVRLLPLT